MPDFEVYQSPFSWRYGSKPMRQLWSENNKRITWRKVWVILAEVQSEFGLVTPEQVADLKGHMNDIDMVRSTEIEAEIQHDLMAELKTFAEQCPLGGRILHLGATSMDIEDNADVIRLRESLTLIQQELGQLLLVFCDLIEKWADTPLMAFTHLQPAEPSTLGYRFAMYAQDLLADYQALQTMRDELRGKGFKGAVGTRASYSELIGTGRLDEFETRLSEKLGIKFFPITSQTYPRRQDYLVVSLLAGLGACLYKMAFDFRFLQTPSVGELSEPFSDKQVGSSAMPFKRNPIRSEKINSLGRYLAQLPRLAWDNAAHSLLERTLDDSANRRVMLPEACLALEEMLRSAYAILKKLNINEHAIERNLSIYAPFAGTEKIMMAAVKAGADRQAMHENLRSHAMLAWQEIQAGNPNPLLESICLDKEIRHYLNETEIRTLLDTREHIGDSPTRARSMAISILEILNKK
ncbi:MAG: adenylosuccinate lyase [Chloroflexi bacterium GWB2_49_20]|nr:MAG: adenylosuccinate lyase [Chloroflexi bacterium GWB2_49_20]OGN79549.1 MAG: adenylosuccinate lyase [Chloroflexi bacterium GWC2_49_37]OGN84528.1 MAG: adenylosuccinate lyase [Chloroflexi bacterium GWD2_49_16]HBG74049.1 adenylosuccinate lyase [Anaerolineae bacterium]HCC78851.1 adenylosuccinate lyase [Anaerolineae bacterium]